MSDVIRALAPFERRGVDRRVRPPAFGVDRRETGPRSEVRFLASPGKAAEVRTLAEANLSLTDRETPWYTTTYCDTGDYALYRGAETGSGSLLRLREYHQRRPESAFASARIWVEWKDEERERSEKQRLIVRPVDVAPFLRGEPLESGDLLVTLRRRGLLAGGLRPVVITQCRRIAYASRRDDVRVTLDHELTYYRPEPTSEEEPAPCHLGAIVARETGVIIEVKWRSEVPEWTARLLQELRREAADRPSKFVVAMRALLAGAPSPNGEPFPAS